MVHSQILRVNVHSFASLLYSKKRYDMKYFTFVLMMLLNVGVFGQVVEPNEEGGGESMEFDFPGNKILEIHPNIDDFFFGKNGRILISTTMDDIYHTSFQEEDGSVNIQADLDLSLVGVNVYFRVVNPDLDDASSYESDSNGGDNEDMNVGNGILSSAIVEAIDSGSGFATAQTKLTITDQYSGDNYLVEASLSPDFSESIVSTSVLVAWKRVYIEFDQMYINGGTIGEYIGDSNNNPDLIAVDNVSDFSVGDQVEIFTYSNQSSITATIEAIPSANQLLISDSGSSFTFPPGSGIKLSNNNQAFDISRTLVKDGYGSSTFGEDGGAFVEFIWDIEGSGKIPKYTQLPNNPSTGEFLSLWRRSDCDTGTGQGTICENYVYLVAGNDFEIPSFGLSDNFSNFTILFEDELINSSISILNFDVAQSEILVHELGHQFELNVGTLPAVHDVNSVTDFPNHEYSDQGVMTYDRNREDGEAEFFIDCIYWIRNLLDKI